MVDVKENNMDANPSTLGFIQPQLFSFGETSEGMLELFPTVWAACEELLAQDVNVRRSGVNKLIAVNAPRFSPLVAYILATRLSDPDLELRKQVVTALADLLVIDEKGLAAPENVRQTLHTRLRHMQQSTVLALLEVGEADSKLEDNLATLFNADPEAGSLLTAILAERKNRLGIRMMAVRMIRRVGYLDTVTDLEKLASRMENRINGQQAMLFSLPVMQDEHGLLGEIRATLLTLREP